MSADLIAKYNIPGPRYTSYPTVPYWDESRFSTEGWLQAVKRSFAESREQGLSLYLHLPFCEKLCTFCGCTKRITKNHDVEGPYIEAVLKEWEMYRELLGERPKIAEMHLGGGTPTFFSAENLGRLIDGILEPCDLTEDFSFSLEGNPNNTRSEHLQVLFDRGFRRVSYGVQDFDPFVQEIINRIQPFETVKEVVQISRDIGYDSVNFDLVYGLPFQKKASIVDTIEKVEALKPDRIAFYSYAHVPWVKGTGQRRFTESDLPRDHEKRELYELGREMLEAAGYLEVGMDHFALKTDSLYRALLDGTLHRNFMGYTEQATQLMIGLGMSAIGDSWYGFAQNHKTVEAYQHSVENGEWPVFRGHLLDAEDLRLRKHILNLMCRFETHWNAGDVDLKNQIDLRLAEPQSDGLIVLDEIGLRILPAGQPFVRNICMAFDARLWRKQPERQIFSMTI